MKVHHDSLVSYKASSLSGNPALQPLRTQGSEEYTTLSAHTFGKTIRISIHEEDKKVILS